MNVHSWGRAVSEEPDRVDQFSLLVQRAELLVLASPDTTPNVSALSRTLGVSERALRNAFIRTYGLSPCRHLRMLRLTWVRRALLSAHDQAVTVTEIAMNFGFTELGRFSADYRKAFGESPSATLRRAGGPPTARWSSRR